MARRCLVSATHAHRRAWQTRRYGLARGLVWAWAYAWALGPGNVIADNVTRGTACASAGALSRFPVRTDTSLAGTSLHAIVRNGIAGVPRQG